MIAMMRYGELKKLSERYRSIRDLEDGMTAQRRGQEFNNLIADIFQSYGIPARAGVRRSIGEIDVHFAIGGNRYILEAKWESRPVDQGAIAKLRDRLAESLAGTRGVLLSMSGFTPEAIMSTRFGKQLSLVLMDRSHIEALLSGVLDPIELIDGMVDYASFMGEPTAPVSELISGEPNRAAEDVVSFGSADGCPDSFIVGCSAPESVSAYPVLLQHDWSASGVGFRSSGEILLTTSHGIIEANRKEQSLNWVGRARSCMNNSVELDDGSVCVVRKSGVVAFSGNSVRVVGGGLVGNARVFRGPFGDLWAIENGGDYPGCPVMLTWFGDRVGDERRIALDSSVAPSGSMLGVVATGDSILVIGHGFVSRIDFDGHDLVGVSTRPHGISNPGDLALMQGRVIGIGGYVSLSEILLDGDPVEVEWVKMALGGSVYHLASRGNEMIISAPCLHGPSIPHYAVVILEVHS